MRVDALSLKCIQYIKYIKPKLLRIKIASVKPDFQLAWELPIVGEGSIIPLN